MTDFYEPTLLFRQNAIRHSGTKRFNPSLSPISSVESLMSTLDNSENSMSSAENTSPSSSFYKHSGNSASSRSSWLLNLNNPKDTEALNKICAINRTNIKSNYWKIPDDDMNLTSMCIKSSSHGNAGIDTLASANENTLLAISSGNRENNLFIYELNVTSNHLIHHSTISLPNINTMKWVNTSNSNSNLNDNNTPEMEKNYIVTGNNKGYAHLVLLPEITTHEPNPDEELASAEICKRFNHRKYIKRRSQNSSQDDDYYVGLNSPITNLDLFNSNKEMVSIYNDYLFHWDMQNAESQQRPTPLSYTKISGICDFDTLPNNNTTLSICGKFGLSLFDTRTAKFSIPMSPVSLSGTGTATATATATAKNIKNYRQLSANIIKWNPSNTNILAAGHGDGVVRLWDIRKQDYFATLNCHSTNASNTGFSSRFGNVLKVTSLEWSQGDLITGGQNGDIIHWDLTSDINLDQVGHLNCGLRQGWDSVKRGNVSLNPSAEASVDVNQRQCGTILPASNSNIVSMCSLAVGGKDGEEDVKILSIDGSSFLGVHSRVKEAVKLDIDNSKMYYTQQDLDSLLREIEAANDKLGINLSLNLDSEVRSSASSFVSLCDSEKPLVISRKPSMNKPLVSSEPNTRIFSINSASGSGSETEVEEVFDYKDSGNYRKEEQEQEQEQEEEQKVADEFKYPPDISTPSPKFNHDSIEVMSLDDFDFSSLSFDSPGNDFSGSGLGSCFDANAGSGSDVSTRGSPNNNYASPLGSVDTLSTMATVVEHIPHEHKSDNSHNSHKTGVYGLCQGQDHSGADKNDDTILDASIGIRRTSSGSHFRKSSYMDVFLSLDHFDFSHQLS